MKSLHQILYGFVLFLFLLLNVHAQYTSPGTGQNFNLDSLVMHSSGAVTTNDTSYFINGFVIISNTDTLNIKPGTKIIFTNATGNDYLEIRGTLYALGSVEDSIVITSTNKTFGDYYGISFRNISADSYFRMNYCRIEYATQAIDIISADAIVSNCLIQHSSEVGVDLFASNSTIQNCHFHHNKQYTLKMTQNSSPNIIGNTFTENNFENTSPYVIITIGLQGVNSPLVKNNTIIGAYEKSGGIAIWANSNALVENNYIENCGYGILCYSTGANPTIKDNTIIANTIHPDTLNWGFGIACNGNNTPIITRNIIQGNYYGVAIINGAQPNCGNLNNADTTDDGENHFLGNGIGNNLYELYNNNSLPIFAENNWWGTGNPDSIEARIVHQHDNPAFGPVDFEPFIPSIATYMADKEILAPQLIEIYNAYPNPFNHSTQISFRIGKSANVEIKIFNISGQYVNTIAKRFFAAGYYNYTWNGTNFKGQDVSSGIYFYTVEIDRNIYSNKILLLK